jgi:hypothetical protein
MLLQGMNLGQSTHCYAKSREEVPPRTKTTSSTGRTVATIFVAGTKLLILDVLPREETFNQNHFLAAIASELSKEKLDNSLYYNGRKIQECFAR